MRQTTYGGRLTENCVQAIARDLLADAMLRVAQIARYEIVAHCHDEIITLTDAGDVDALRALNKLMATVPAWASGLIMAADGAEGERYSK